MCYQKRVEKPVLAALIKEAKSLISHFSHHILYSIIVFYSVLVIIFLSWYGVMKNIIKLAVLHRDVEQVRDVFLLVRKKRPSC